MTDTPPPPVPSTRLSAWGWFAIIVLIGLLLVAIAYAVHAWGVIDATMSTAGWVFLILGIVVTTALGAGLMALVFYSSRHDYDR
jgi:hypothetical protein